MWWIFGRKPRKFSPSDTLPFVRASDAEEPVQLVSLDVQVRVHGLFAETTQTMRFHNPNRRVLEGDLSFPMTDGAVVCGYALDVNGTMMDAVIVPKHEARRILEAEIRKGVDPGLVEKTRGNIYRTRLYPIPARGERTVRITTVSALSVSGNSAAYDLPLKHAEQIDKVKLRVEVVRSPVQPTISGGLGNLTMNQWNDTWIAEATLGVGRPSDDLQVRLPDLPDTFSMVEKTAEGDLFFAASTLNRTPETPVSWKPKRIAIAWDASGSRSDIDRDLAIVKQIPKVWPGVIVDLVVVRNTVSEVQTFDTSTDGGTALLAAIEGQPRDGASALSLLDFSKAPNGGEAWLLFSDGLSSIGKGLPTCGDTPVYCLSGQVDSDGTWLEHVARQTGGRNINLVTMPEQEAVAALTTPSHTPVLVKSFGSEHVTVREAGDRLLVVGKLTASAAKLTVRSGDAQKEFEIDTADAAAGQSVARAWAGQRAEELALTDGEKSEAVVSLARRYGVVTSGMSLLVLESLEQFIEHDIEPPDTFPKFQRKWRARRKKKNEKDAKKRRTHVDLVADWWTDRVTWWETDFEAKRREDKRKKEAQAPTTLRSVRQPAAEEGSAPMAPAPMALPTPQVFTRQAASPSPDMDLIVGAAAPSPAPVEHAKKSAKPSGRQASIAIQPWEPDTPYLAAMRRSDDPYETYLEHRARYAKSPSFFLDCGDHLLRAEQHEIGLRVLSNLMELGLDDPALLRMYAWRLQQAQELDLAVEVLEHVRKLRADEPQSFRDLALELALRFDRDGDEQDAQRAIELLYEVVQRDWDRFPQIELIALVELNRLVHLLEARDIKVATEVDERLIGHLDLDLRISMSWDADLTDVDLHVFEPDGGHAYYGDNLTTIGGLVSRDFTEGYGPEEYVLRKAIAGDYLVRAHYYGSSQQNLVGPCTVIVTVYTNWGREDEHRQVLTLRLDKPGDQIDVGKVTIGDKATGSMKAGSWKSRFRALRIGMTMNEVRDACGKPDELQGDEQIVLVYRPEEDIEVHVLMAPKLRAVQQVMDGAVVDMVR